MMLKFLCSLLVLLLTSGHYLAFKVDLPELENGGVHWALLVAGSNTWSNYRHQADICHAYQVLHKNGIPDERIVVMMYDDIAHNPSNPEPGKVINKPGGVNVYPGVLKDYIGNDVAPSTFLNVLQGKKEALNGRGSGKVINSGPNDNVFVYFADHGAPGIIAFPSEYLHASQLHTAIMNMHEKKRYNKMVLYIEACESGSMFPGLPKDIKVFATTAANDQESSYACYYDSDLGTYLGDVYSVCWMENSDKVNLASESLQQQFKIVKKETNTSHVQEFGDLSISSMKLSSFQGNHQSEGMETTERYVEQAVPRFDLSNSVDARETTIYVLQRRIHDAKSKEEQEVAMKMLHEEYMIRETISVTIQNIVRNASVDLEQVERVNQATYVPVFTSCYEEAIDHLHYTCLQFQNHEFLLTQFKLFVNLCNDEVPISTITRAIDKVCGRRPYF